jgi:hypothetical protein
LAKVSRRKWKTTRQKLLQPPLPPRKAKRKPHP